MGILKDFFIKLECLLGWHDMDINSMQSTTPSGEPDRWGISYYGVCKNCGKDCEH